LKKSQIISKRLSDFSDVTQEEKQRVIFLK